MYGLKGLDESMFNYNC